MESPGAHAGPRSHYRRIGFGVRQLRLQIRRTKPQGFGSSIEMRQAINFIICLQMRCTLLPSLGCVCVFICRWEVGGCHCVRNIKPCMFSLWSDVTDITKKKSNQTTDETTAKQLWITMCRQQRHTQDVCKHFLFQTICVHEMNVCRPETLWSRQSETGSEFGKHGICPTLNDL